METASFLIIGGCGHQGTHIVKLLRERYPEAKVAVMSRNPNVNNLPGVEYLKGDVTSSDDLERVFEASKPTAVFHTAALIVAFRKRQSITLMHDVNVGGTQKSIDASKKFGVTPVCWGIL